MAGVEELEGEGDGGDVIGPLGVVVGERGEGEGVVIASTQVVVGSDAQVARVAVVARVREIGVIGCVVLL